MRRVWFGRLLECTALSLSIWTTHTKSNVEYFDGVQAVVRAFHYVHDAVTSLESERSRMRVSGRRAVPLSVTRIGFAWNFCPH